MPHLRDLPARLEGLARRDLLRRPTEAVRHERAGSRALLDLTSNDYLGLATAHVSRETRTTARPGAGASRLVFGTHEEHSKLEAELADWCGFEEALLFTSGYGANLGALGCLLEPGDVVLSDALNHASLIDGCRLSRAAVQVLPHRDLHAFEEALRSSGPVAARWVVVESYYSMDGVSPDLVALRALCDRYDAHLYVDEAHGLGIFGDQGAGLCAERGVRPDVLLGGLGKACGGQGGFVAGSTTVRDWLWNRARSFVFSTAPSPVLAALLLDQVRRARQAEDLRRDLRERANRFRRRLEQLGVPLIADSHGPIVGVLLGEAERALGVAAVLRERGILTQAIRPPTVPPGSSRLRLTVTANHAPEDLERAATALAQALETLPASLR